MENQQWPMSPPLHSAGSTSENESLLWALEERELAAQHTSAIQKIKNEHHHITEIDSIRTIPKKLLGTFQSYINLYGLHKFFLTFAGCLLWFFRAFFRFLENTKASLANCFWDIFAFIFENSQFFRKYRRDVFEFPGTIFATKKMNTT